jgi:hypothetical protein
MPQRRRTTPRARKTTPLGPYDLSTRKLPGGTEIQALAAGYASLALRDSQEAGYPARERAKEQKVGYDQGYVEAAGVANNRIIRDTNSAYLLTDVTKPHGGIFRAVELNAVMREYTADIEASVGHSMPTTDSTRRKMLDKAMGLKKGQKTADGLPAEFRFHIKPGLSLTHVAPAKKFFIEQDKAAMNAYVGSLLGHTPP